jgi:hypothetical protein
MSSEFERELEVLINKHSMENASNTPDFILADYLMKCLETYNHTIQRRSQWYKPNTKISVNEIAPTVNPPRKWEICTVYPERMPKAYCGYNGQNLQLGYLIHAVRFLDTNEKLEVGDWVEEGQIEKFLYYNIGDVRAQVRLRKQYNNPLANKRLQIFSVVNLKGGYKMTPEERLNSFGVTIEIDGDGIKIKPIPQKG